MKCEKCGKEYDLISARTCDYKCWEPVSHTVNVKPENLEGWGMCQTGYVTLCRGKIRPILGVVR